MKSMERKHCKSSERAFGESVANITFIRFTVFIGHVNGVNVISLQQNAPAMSASGLKPPLINQPSVDFSSLQMHLQPRRPTTGNVDFLMPLQPELLLGEWFIELPSDDGRMELMASNFPRIDRKELGPPTTVLPHFNLEPKVTFFAESSSSSGFANDKDDILNMEWIVRRIILFVSILIGRISCVPNSHGIQLNTVSPVRSFMNN